MIKRAFYRIPWDTFICLTSIFLGIGLVVLLSYFGCVVNTFFGILGLICGFLLDVLIVPFCWELADEVKVYFSNKVQ